jgi:hypothetical protein
MKKIMMIVAVAAGMSTTALAQNQEVTTKGSAQATKKDLTPEERAKRGADHAEKKLGLTADQKSQWEVAALKRNMANQPYHDQLKGATTPEQRKDIHAQMKANNQAFEKSVDFFLTADQKTKFTAMKQERMAAKKKEMKKDFDESHVDYGDN